MDLGNNEQGFQIGQNYGTISTGFHPLEYSVRSPAPQPIPCVNVPFPRDRDFVDLNGLIETILEGLSQPFARLLLAGLPGVGKSSLALECAWRHNKVVPDSWVFWVDGSSEKTFSQGVEEIAEQLEISNRNRQAQNFYRQISDALSRRRGRRWLIILDAVNNADYLLKPPDELTTGSRQWTKPLIECFPISELGSILITARNKVHAARLGVSDEDIHDVWPIDNESLTELFLRKLGKIRVDEDSAVVHQVLDELDYMPKSITNTATYLRQHGLHKPLHEHLKQLQEPEVDLAHDTISAPRVDRSTLQAQSTVRARMQELRELIEKLEHSAVDLLMVMSMLADSDVPIDLMRKPKDSAPEFEASEALFDDNFARDLRSLQDFMLVQHKHDERSFRLPRIVGRVMRSWPKTDLNLQTKLNRIVSNFDKMLPRDPLNDWLLYEQLYPHVTELFASVPSQHLVVTSMWASVLAKIAAYDLQDCNPRHAEEICRASQANILDPGHKIRLLRETLLAQALVDQCRFDEAESLVRSVLPQILLHMGPNDEAIIAAKEVLSRCLLSRGYENQAIYIILELIDDSVRIFGCNDPRTIERFGAYYLSSISKVVPLPKLYDTPLDPQQAPSKAIAIHILLKNIDRYYWSYEFDSPSHIQNYKKSLQDSQQQIMSFCGQNFPFIEFTKFALAHIDLNKQWTEKSKEDIFKQLRVLSNRMGQTHRLVLNASWRLALTLWRLGRLEEAHNLILDLKTRCRDHLGPRHIRTIGCMRTFAGILRDEHQYDKAQAVLSKVSELKELIPKEDGLAQDLKFLELINRCGFKQDASKILQLRVNSCRIDLGDSHPLTKSASELLRSWRGTIENQKDT